MAQDKDKKIVLNMAGGLALIVVNTIIFFILSPFMRKYWGDTMLGAWYFIQSMTGIIAVLPSSFSIAVTKYVAQYNSEENVHELNRFCSTAIILYWGFMFISALLCLALLLLTDSFTVISQSDDSQLLKITFTLMLVNTLLQLPFTAIRAALLGFHRYDIDILIQLMQNLCYAGAVVLIVTKQMPLYTLALSIIAVTLVSNLFYLFFLYRQFPFHFSINSFDRALVKQLIRFGMVSLLGIVANILFYRCDALVIGAMFPGSILFFYTIGFRMIEKIGELNISAIRVLMPVASEVSTFTKEKRQQKVEGLFIRGSRFSAILIMPMILFFLVFGKDFFRLWQGDDYQGVSESYWVFFIIAIPQLWVATQQIGVKILEGFSRHQIMIRLMLVMAILNLVLSIIFARIFGIVGVALGTAIPLLVSRGYMHFYYKKVFGISMLRYYRMVWLKIMPFGVSLLLIMLCQHHFVTFPSVYHLFGMALIYFSVFWLFSYCLLDEFEKSIIKKIFCR